MGNQFNILDDMYEPATQEVALSGPDCQVVRSMKSSQTSNGPNPNLSGDLGFEPTASYGGSQQPEPGAITESVLKLAVGDT